MYRFRIEVLRAAAARLGDTTGYAIHRRTGIAESSVYRYLAGKAQPDLNSVLVLAEAYEVSVESLMVREPESVPA